MYSNEQYEIAGYCQNCGLAVWAMDGKVKRQECIDGFCRVERKEEMNTEELQQDIRANLRIIQVGGQNAFYLYQDKQISLSKLLALISETITDNYEVQIKK